MKKLLFLIPFTLFANNGEYIFKEANFTENFINPFFNAPNVYTSTQCTKGQNPICWPVIKNEKGQILRSYSKDDSVSSKIKGRYQNIAYLLYSHFYKRGKRYKTEYILIDNKGKTYPIPPYFSDALDSIITKDANILQVKNNGIYLNRTLKAKTKYYLTQAKIGNNPKGDISVIAIDNQNTLISSNTEKFINTQATLAPHGDRKGILTTYPVNKDLAVWSVYKYVNSYNKGLLIGKTDFKNNKSYYGWLFNSELRNVGFNPKIYETNKEAFILATDSSNSKRVIIKVPLNKIEKSVNITPEHIKGFEDEKYYSFIIGTSISYLDWKATNKVEDEYDNSYGKVKYDISKALYKAIYLQGRKGDTQIAINYLKNEAEKKGQTTKKASKFLNAVIDINSLFSKSSTLRILAQKGEVNGIVNYNGIDIYGEPVINREFTTKIDKYAALIMEEKGFYWGFDYTKYYMPSLLGFSKGGDVKFVLFDPKTKIQKFTIDFGYDELSYAKRYENDFNRWFIEGVGGIGIGLIKMSDDSYAKTKAKELGYDGINTPWTIAIDYGINVGYIFQRKAKLLYGLGITLQIGIKANGTYYFAGTSSQSDSTDNKLDLQFERNDIWYGPYISLNLVY